MVELEADNSCGRGLDANQAVGDHGVADLAAKAGRPLRDIFVWLDYGSIPQTCKPVQRLSVLSLPSLASAVDVFLAAAPKALNRDTLEACDAATYASRAWCRAEIFAHFSRRGGDVMYFATADGVRPMFPKPRGGDLKCAPCAPAEAGADFFKSALDVMHGKLTCCRHGHAWGIRTSSEGSAARLSPTHH